MKISNLKTKSVILVGVAAALSFFNPLIVKAHLPVESLIYYQQTLKDINGKPITTPTSVKFTIYHQEEEHHEAAEEEDHEWSETYDQDSGDCQKLVPDKKGVVNVKLGFCNPFPNIYTEIKDNHGQFYLGVSINGAAEIEPKINIADLFLTAQSYIANQGGQVLGAETDQTPKAKSNSFQDSNLLGGGGIATSVKTKSTVNNLILGSVENKTDVPVSQTETTTITKTSDTNAVEGNFNANTSINIIDILESSVLTNLNTNNLQVNNLAVFNGDIDIKGKVTFNADTVGQAEILRGNTNVRISYANEYLYPPIVTLTPIGQIDANSYYLSDSDKTGFTIKLTSKNSQNVLFNWHAFASDKEKLYVSAGFQDPLNDPECKGYSWIRGFDQNHSGADLAVYKGCPIEAIAAGTVTYASFEETSGYTVKIDHGDGIESRYYHGDGTFWVNVGDHVEAGQRIMMMGQSGNATGVHLHLEVSVDGVTVDPALYVPFNR